MLVITQKQKSLLASGSIVKVVDIETLEKFNVAMDKDGKLHIVVSTAKPYSNVKLYDSVSSDLNLTQEETKELMEKHEVRVYRSSGAKDGDRTLTREEQIAQGKARVIDVVCEFLGGDKKDVKNYVPHILKDDTNSLAEEVPFMEVK